MHGAASSTRPLHCQGKTRFFGVFTLLSATCQKKKPSKPKPKPLVRAGAVDRAALQNQTQTHSSLLKFPRLEVQAYSLLAIPAIYVTGTTPMASGIKSIVILALVAPVFMYWLLSLLTLRWYFFTPRQSFNLEVLSADNPTLVREVSARLNIDETAIKTVFYMYDDLVCAQRVAKFYHVVYHLASFAHRCAVALAFALFFPGQGSAQLGVLLAVNLSFILYFAAASPFFSRLSNAAELALIVCESCILLLAALLLNSSSLPVQKTMVAFYFVHIALSIIPEAAKGIIVCLDAARKKQKKQH